MVFEIRAIPATGWPRCTTLSVDGGETLELEGPFAQAALHLVASGTASGEVLRALIRGSGGPLVRAHLVGDSWQTSCEVPLGELLASEMPDDHWLHVTTTDSDGLVEVAPVRRSRGDADRFVTAGLKRANNEIVPISVALRPDTAKPVPLIPITAIATPLVTIVASPPTHGGPVLGPVTGAMRDRDSSAQGWYLPGWSWEAPGRGQVDPQVAPFSFRIRREGYTMDGRDGIVAVVRFRLSKQAPAGLDVSALRELPAQYRVQLAIPYRDESGEARIEYHASTRQEINQDELIVDFEVRDQWARMAYGALSTPGFQSAGAQLVVTATYSGWRLQRRRIVGEKIAVGLAGREELRPSLSMLAGARVNLKPIAHRVDISALLEVTKSELVWSQVTERLDSIEVLVDCAISGELYRMLDQGLDTALGCQPVFSLGQGEPRTHEVVDVTAASGRATILRSLTRPRRFLVVPATYCIGRYGPDVQDVAYQPSLLLHSTIDVDSPENIRCVIAAGLQMDVPGHLMAQVEAELAGVEGGPVVLESPWEAGLIPTVDWALPSATTVECLACDTGFQLIVSSDVPGFLTLQSLLRTAGVSGLATYTLPDGTEVTSQLRLALDRVVGPYPHGGIRLSANGSEVELRNELTRRVAVGELLHRGVKVASIDEILAPGDSTRVACSETTDLTVNSHVEPGSETLNEMRAYVEDLQLNLVLVATKEIPQGDSIDVVVTMRDDGARAEVSLNDSKRQADVTFTLPLTRYLADPQLDVTTSRGGLRLESFTWAVRTQGVLIPLSVPEERPVS
ncbi:MAG: hypothetical protein CSA84_04675 [Actinomycetales bacterium]|nr:MAG: hypothetical protein CSA84_04675 [Actinomycetales bacterium]